MESRVRFDTDPVDYHLEDDRCLCVRWRDGHESLYSFDELRKACPCADCRTTEKPQGGELRVLTSPVVRSGEIRIVQISPVGRYALSFTWSDGHSTGIYSFDFLRRLCPCGVCRSRAG